MTTAPQLDIEKCRELLALSMNYEIFSDDKAHLIGLLSDQLRAALALLAEAREALADLIAQIESCDGTAQLQCRWG